jgi:hypothetical protein
MQGVEDGDDAPPEEPAPSQGRARIKHTTSSKDRPQRQQEKRKGSQQQVGRLLFGSCSLSCMGFCTGQRLSGTYGGSAPQEKL